MAERDVYRVTVRGAGRAATSLDRLQRGIQDALIAELRETRRQGLAIIREEIPEDTEALQESVEARLWTRVRRPRLRFALTGVRGHGTRHDYTDVVRFGHRQERLTPTDARALAVHPAGHRNQSIVVYRASVGPAWSREAYPGDFVENAQPKLDRLMDEAEARLGRRIDRKSLRP